MVLNEPVAATFQISAANPNTNTQIKKTPTSQLENANPGCKLIQVIAKGRDLVKVGNSFRLRFSVRIQQ